MTALAEKIREFMDISPDIKRMDSMMIESNIKKMGRLELLYTCLSNLVRTIHREGSLELPKDLDPYADPNDRNRVIYYEQDIPQNERLQKVIDDATELMPLCKDGYEHTEEYQLLLRAIGEQTKKDDKGNRTPKEKGDGMDSTVLQNPSDPDATYRAKAWKQHRGYVANLTESVDKKGSVVTDYQYDVNTRSDASFLKDVIEEADVSEETITFIADGAYSSQEIQDIAAEKNIRILTTGRRSVSRDRLICMGLQIHGQGHSTFPDAPSIPPVWLHQWGLLFKFFIFADSFLFENILSLTKPMNYDTI